MYIPTIQERLFPQLLAILFLASCTTSPTLPLSYSVAKEKAPIYPEYRSITVPSNIAPLNVWVQDSLADDAVVQMGNMVIGTDADGKTDIDIEQWHSMLATNAGKDILFYVYTHRDAGWVRYLADTIHVAEEPIDSFLSYRIIEPGYELYRQLGLYQRDLTSYDVQTIYENNRTYDDDDNHCINCHNYRNYDTRHMLFHVRGQHGGTVIVNDGDIRKIAIKHDSILAAGVYPSWHPSQPLVAFSTNKTGQAFHLMHQEKIEVIDEASDLILYNVHDNTVSNILRTDSCLETFPCWSPDGTRLYYCSAHLPDSVRSTTETGKSNLLPIYDNLRYNIWSMPFDSTTCTFGEPRLEVDAAAIGKSASVPRISPDGKWLLYTLGDYGQFHIWHTSARLWVKGEEQEEGSLVTDCHASYHTFSHNGRWIVFSSRRDDGTFTRLYIAYFDKEGHAHRPFMLPQQDPESNILLLKSYNVPELSRNSVQTSAEQLQQFVLTQQAITAKYTQQGK